MVLQTSVRTRREGREGKEGRVEADLLVKALLLGSLVLRVLLLVGRPSRLGSSMSFSWSFHSEKRNGKRTSRWRTLEGRKRGKRRRARETCEFRDDGGPLNLQRVFLLYLLLKKVVASDSLVRAMIFETQRQQMRKSGRGSALVPKAGRVALRLLPFPPLCQLHRLSRGNVRA